MLAAVIVLGARPFRSVTLEAASGAPLVVKRFHHPNRLLALFDGARARREFAALEALARAGLPVPRALALRRTPAGFELEQSAITGARTLRELLDGRREPPGGWPRLAAQLGRILAELQAAGWEHGDLHPGNVLVDALGAAWLVDLAAARRAPPERARALAEVVQCAAVAREFLPARTRARFLVAWLRALPCELRPGLGGAALLTALERRARERRRHQVRLGLGRWLRPSSRVQAFAHEGARAWRRRELSDEVAREACVAPAAAHGRWVVIVGDRSELRARWLGAARLLEHGLPVARPALFVPGPRWAGRRARAVFEPPPAACRARSRAELDARLAECGLALAPASAARIETPGGFYLAPPREPEDLLELEAPC